MKITNEKTNLRIRLSPSCILKDGCGFALGGENKNTACYFIGLNIWQLLDINPALMCELCNDLSKAMSISPRLALNMLADDNTQGGAAINLSDTNYHLGITLIKDGNRIAHQMFSCRFSPREQRMMNRYISAIKKSEALGKIQKAEIVHTYA